MADVERRTTITAGLNTAPMKEGLAELRAETSKTASSMTESVNRMSRAQLDGVKGFEALARKYVEGVREAQRYADEIQKVERAFANFRDMGMYTTVLQAVERAFGTAGTAAKQFAQAMGDPANSAQQRVQALQNLVQIMQAVKRGHQEMAAEIGRQQPAPTPRFSGITRAGGDLAPGQRQMLGQEDRELLRAIATGRVDMQGLATLGYDRTLGTPEAREAIRRFKEQGLLRQSRAGGRFGPLELGGAEAYGLAGLTAPAGALGIEAQRSQSGIAAQPVSYVNRPAREKELEAVFASVLDQEVLIARAAANAANVRMGTERFGPLTTDELRALNTRYGTDQFGPITAAQRQAELMRSGSEPFGPITRAQAAAQYQAANMRYGTEQFGPMTTAQRQAELMRYGSEQFGPMTAAQRAAQYQAANMRYGTEQFGPMTTAQMQAANMRYGSEAFGPMTLAQSQAANTRMGHEQFGPMSPDQARQQAAALDAIRAKYDHVFRASKEYERELNLLNEAHQKLIITDRVYEQSLDRLNKQFDLSSKAAHQHGQSLDDLTGSNGRTQFAMRQLGVQTVQTLQGFATGQPVMMTLIQQGHQMIDVMLSAEVSARSLGSAIVSTMRAILTPTTIAMGAIAAVAAAVVFSVMRAEQAQSRLRALAEQVSAQRPGQGMEGAEMVERASRRLAATTPLSREGAFDAGSIIARSRLFTGTQEQMEELIKLGENLRIKLGIDLPDAMKILTDAAKDPGKAAEEAGQKFAVFSGQVQRINDLVREGKLKEAVELFFKTMKEATEGASENVSNLTAQWQRFEQLATGDKTGLWRAMGNAMADGLAIGLKAINDLIEALRSLHSTEWEDIPLTRKWWEKRLFGVPNVVPKVGEDLPKQMQDWLRAPGAVATGLSPAGASGIMQLMPRTAAGLGVNPFIPSENVMGGLKYIQQLSEQMKSFPGGLESGVSRAYVAGPHGNLMGGEATAYAEKVATADISKLPTDTVGLIEYWGKVLGMSADQINLGKRIAMVENAGMQLAPSNRIKVVPGVPTEPPAVPAGSTTPPVVPAPGVPTSTGFSTDREAQLKRDLEAANELARQQRENLQERARLQESISLQETKLKEAQASGDQDRIKQEQANLDNLRQKVMTLQGLYTDLIEQSQRMARDAENAAKAFDTQAGAARDFEQIRQKYRDIARQTGRPYDEDAANREIAARQKELSKGFDEATEALQRQNEAQERWLPVARQGSIALEEHVHQLQAEEEARKAAIPASAEYNRLVRERVDALNKEAQIKRDLQIANDNYQQQQNIDFLKEEIALIGQSVAVRNRELAILRARQSLQLKPGQEPRSAEEAEKIKLAGDQADVQTNAERIQQAYREIEQTGEQAFNTIGDAVVASFQEGADAAKIWQNALTSILNDIMREFMKLAIINPLMNEIFGSNRPTTDDLGGGLLGKLFGGGGGGSGSGSGSGSGGGGGGGGGGLFGGLVDMIGGKGFYAGGGLFGSIFGGGGGGGVGAEGGVWDSDTGSADTFHSGGLVGMDAVPIRMLPQGIFDLAPRYQGGLGANEFAAVLHRGERVLTANQNDRLEGVMNRVAGGGGGRGGGGGGNVYMNVTTPNADSFRNSQSQIESRMTAGLNRSQQRSRT